eukprot:289860-Chlamydomonas_euryale.AAC.9
MAASVHRAEIFVMWWVRFDTRTMRWCSCSMYETIVKYSCRISNIAWTKTCKQCFSIGAKQRHVVNILEAVWKRL